MVGRQWHAGPVPACHLRPGRPGSKCCFKAASDDAGGTNTINAGATAKATLTLEPGRYVFLCSIGGHWNGDTGGMRGSLVVS